MKSRRRCAHREVGVDHAHDAALDEVDGLLRGDRRAPVLFAPPVADEDGRGREQKGGGHAQPLQDAGEQDRDVEDAAGARIEQPGRGANGVRTGLPRVAHGLDHHATSAQDGARGRGEGIRVGGAGRPGVLVGRGETERLGRQGANNDLVGLDEGRQRRTRPAPAAAEPPLPWGQHGQPREPAHGGCAVGSVGSAQVDSHVGRPGLIDLKQACAIQCHVARGTQHRVGRVPGQVPGLGDLATAVVLDERERHLQSPRRRRLGDARPDCQGLTLLVIGCEHGRVRAGITRARALREG